MNAEKFSHKNISLISIVVNEVSQHQIRLYLERYHILIDYKSYWYKPDIFIIRTIYSTFYRWQIFNVSVNKNTIHHNNSLTLLIAYVDFIRLTLVYNTRILPYLSFKYLTLCDSIHHLYYFYYLYRNLMI